MNSSKISEEQIRMLLNSRSMAEKEKGLEAIFKNDQLRREIIGMLRKKKVSYQNAQDYYQDASEQLARSVYRSAAEINHSPYSYLRKICINNWLNGITGRKKPAKDILSEPESSVEGSKDDPHFLLERKEQTVWLNELLSRLEPPCDQLILMRGMGYSPAEIARELGLKSAKVVINRRYKCFEKLKEIIKNHPPY